MRAGAASRPVRSPRRQGPSTSGISRGDPAGRRRLANCRQTVLAGLSRGFWPAYSVGLGACSADFLWALAVTLGAGALAGVRAVEMALAMISFVLLLVLAATFTRNAIRGCGSSNPAVS